MLFTPTLLPFFFHWYAGVVPPLKDVALKVTLLPAQIGLLLAIILIEGVEYELTVNVAVVEEKLPQVFVATQRNW